MAQKSISDFISQTLKPFQTLNTPIAMRVHTVLSTLYKTYIESASSLNNDYESTVSTHAHATLIALKDQTSFQPFHSNDSHAKEYTQGITFLSKLVDLSHSTVSGEENFAEIQKNIDVQENVVLFANHQIEADPQAISLLLDRKYPFVRNIIYIAGDRVTTDPIAIPLSLGHNLLCIYSNKYIQSDQDSLSKKRAHNKKAISILQEKLHRGGICVYIAPSGGRDREDENGIVKPAMFDYKSIELIYSLAKRSKTPTHFYPLAIATYSILPPPLLSHISLCESREAHKGSIHLSCGKEILMQKPLSHDKKTNQKLKAQYIYNLVSDRYHRINSPYIENL